VIGRCTKRCIPGDLNLQLNYLRNKNQQDALFYSKFISIINLYM
jgi:hypothetical protein